jgi:RNA polymerase primary sigma factor
MAAATLPDSLTHYLAEIGRNHVLTREEERSLFQRLEEGDETARDEIVACNLRFVVKVAAQFRNRGLPLSDLIQEGNIGLLEVIGKFDWRRGLRFSTYAAFWIRQSIQRALLRGGSFVRLPSRKARLLGKLSRAVEEHRAEYHRDPSVHEMADALGMDAESLKPLLQWRESVLSLDATPDDESGASLMDVIAEEPDASPLACARRNERAALVQRSLERLTPREQKILRLRNGFETDRSLSLRRTSVRVGLSQEGVRRIERLALAKLRRTAEREELALLS